ncbi:YmfQ family protein [Oligella urethralis]|uniref:YmfQ family protein n=1 Tax=Oligella urethralis TaxID=90245 RepID=UPI00288B801C|nr:putative phage tail protein [Oligella urethralis]
MHKNLLSSLLPPVSYDAQAKYLSIEITAEGSLLDGTELSAFRVADAISPYLAAELIVDWERVLDLTPSQIDSYQQRVDRIIVKLAETGGLSIPYFISLANSLGYQISIIELEPFYADYSRVGDRVYEYDIIWVWRVEVDGSQNQKTYPFIASISTTEERLLAFSDPIIETVFEELKPAHTFVYFAYL